MMVCGRCTLQVKPSRFAAAKDLVLLRVVEVLDVLPALLLAKRGRRHRALAVGLERAEIMLQPGHQRDMSDPGALQAVQQVAHHAAVDADILGLGGLSQPGGDEHRIRLQAGEGSLGGGGVLQIGSDRRDARLPVRPACQTVDRPALVEQSLRGGAADDAACTHNQGCLAHDMLSSTSQALQLGDRLRAVQTEPIWNIGT